CTPADEASCPAGFECLDAGGQGACWPEDAGDGGGCCDASGSGAPTALFGLGFVALVLRRRRR
ncbi:MAG TPA: MYXO-CTERM sorting domain-containing protein, partial [Kofleriaceae bacterium]|nr:MYXO-CTERM sorting domain-containing protein [Kofleriaceae bacterium]